jgi:hypothetical protein
MFPDKTSISTVQLQKQREFQYERVGPGAYSLGVEKTNATNAGK